MKQTEILSTIDMKQIKCLLTIFVQWGILACFEEWPLLDDEREDNPCFLFGKTEFSCSQNCSFLMVALIQSFWLKFALIYFYQTIFFDPNYVKCFLYYFYYP